MNNNNTVKVGDYIEGYELWGSSNYKSIHKIRIVVEKIIKQPNEKNSYYGRVDDCYKGSRMATISEEYGNIRIIEDEQPFRDSWWDKSCGVSYSLSKKYVPGSLVRKYDGTMYKLLHIGINAETNEQVIVYRGLYDTTKIYSEPRELFESVDNNTQTQRFELVENS